MSGRSPFVRRASWVSPSSNGSWMKATAAADQAKNMMYGASPLIGKDNRAPASTFCPTCKAFHRSGTLCSRTGKALFNVEVLLKAGTKTAAGYAGAKQRHMYSPTPKGKGGNPWHDSSSGQFTANPQKEGGAGPAPKSKVSADAPTIPKVQDPSQAHQEAKQAQRNELLAQADRRKDAADQARKQAAEQGQSKEEQNKAAWEAWSGDKGRKTPSAEAAPTTPQRPSQAPSTGVSHPSTPSAPKHPAGQAAVAASSQPSSFLQRRKTTGAPIQAAYAMGYGQGSTLGTPGGAATAALQVPRLATGGHHLLSSPFQSRQARQTVTRAPAHQLGQASSHYARQHGNYNSAMQNWAGARGAVGTIMPQPASGRGSGHTLQDKYPTLYARAKRKAYGT